MKKSLFVAVLILLLVMATKVPNVLAWTGYLTGWGTFPTLFGTFDMMVVDYYKNNIYTSVELYLSSQHIDNTGENSINCGRCEVWQGDGTNPTTKHDFFEPPIYPGQYRIQTYYIGPKKYYKNPGTGLGAVWVSTMAGHIGNCFGAGTWHVWFYSDGSIEKEKTW